ncbi:MAG: hypothetical protein CMA70_04500 [Euryarchaeota archaeon]|nr:hypothetical protein [Euryarchaeota archaeon]
MGDTLFPMPEDPSPRLKWIDRHGVTVKDTGYSFQVSTGEEAAEATTLDFALQELAYKLKIKPYNWN